MSDTPESAALNYLGSIAGAILDSASGAHCGAVRVVLSDIDNCVLDILLNHNARVMVAGSRDNPVLTLTLKLETLHALTSGVFDYRNANDLARVNIKGDFRLFREIIDSVRGKHAICAEAYERAENIALRFPITSIKKYAEVTAEVISESIDRTAPIVFTGLEIDSKAGEWTFPSLRMKFGSVVYTRRDNQPVLLGTHLDSIGSGTCKTTGGVLLPEELKSELRWPHSLTQNIGGATYLFLGSAGAITPLHRDAGNGVNAHIIGRKRWTLFSPDQAERLYPRPSELNVGYQHADVELNNPDLELHPLFSSSRPIQITVHPGEILLVPSGWFHHVELMDDALSVTLPILSQ